MTGTIQRLCSSLRRKPTRASAFLQAVLWVPEAEAETEIEKMQADLVKAEKVLTVRGKILPLAVKEPLVAVVLKVAKELRAVTEMQEAVESTQQVELQRSVVAHSRDEVLV